MNGSKDRDGLAEALGFLAGRQQDLSRRADDRARLERVQEGVLHRNGDVSEAPSPFARGAFLKGEWHDHFELTARSETPLVEPHVLEGGFIAARDCRLQDRLVFGKRLLGDEGAREIQLAARPRAVGRTGCGRK